MKSIRQLLKFLLRLLIVWIVDAIALLLTASLLPGMTIYGENLNSRMAAAASAALVLGIVNMLIRPIFLLLARPLGGVAILVLGFFLNAIVLKITSGLIPSFEITNWLTAFMGGFIFAAINGVITDLLTLSDDDSLYQAIVERRARKRSFKDAHGPDQGVIYLEIDGLSYHHMQKALSEGWMPTLAELQARQGYQLHKIETGLPSMTTSCQAGILYGDNFDIPSFRWFDRDLNRMVVSQKDAGMLDARYSKGQGLVRGGTSIANMLNGDAEKSMFVLSAIRARNEEEKKQRAEDAYLLMLNPYFFIHTLVLYFWDVVVEIYEYTLQVIQNVQPRLNRLHKAFPFLRAGMTAVMKEISRYLIILDIIRGTPALYHTYAGYDEMAHHAGPWTKDAFHELKRFDRVIAHILKAAATKAPRPYELIVLSDHGQSFGATFLQRYGITLHDFIQQHLPQGPQVGHSVESDDGSTGVISMMGEFENIQDQKVGSRLGRSMVGGANQLMQKGIDQRQEPAQDQDANIRVAFSGNLANVYFDLFPRRVMVSELNSAYPGMVDALIQHEGFGFIVGYDDQGVPFCFGKRGSRNLYTGAVTGEDPLQPYGDVELRSAQVRRLADFPHAGDLIVNSTLYPDGTVAAMEELIGNHGGLGGEQTDAFIFAPAEVHIPETQNSTDLYAILNSRRGIIPAPPVAQAEKEIDAWAPSTLLHGLGRVSIWLGQFARVLAFDRSVYSEVAEDAFSTGPAVLLSLVFTFTSMVVYREEFTAMDFILRFALWLLTVLIIWGSGWLLGGKGTFTTTLRAMGFAHSVYAWGLLGLIPQVSIVIGLIVLLVAFLANWMGASIALKINGWKSLLLPVVVVSTTFIGYEIIKILLSGAVLTLTTLGSRIGILP